MAGKSIKKQLPFSDCVNEIPVLKGSYILVGQLCEQRMLKIVSLGNFLLQPGFYYYCGSAKGNGGLRARIGRHFNIEKKVFWHIDYLIPFIKLINLYWCDDEKISECQFISMVDFISYISHPIKKFGAGDCFNNCKSHLVFSFPMFSPSWIYDFVRTFDICLHDIPLNRNLIES